MSGDIQPRKTIQDRIKAVLKDQKVKKVTDTISAGAKFATALGVQGLGAVAAGLDFLKCFTDYKGKVSPEDFVALTAIPSYWKSFEELKLALDLPV